MEIVLTLLFLICPIATVTFIARLVCAPFSRKVSREMRSHPIVHCVWGGCAFLGVLLLTGAIDTTWWPLPSVERRGQRQKMLQRVEAAGGWAAIQKDCDALVSEHPEGVFFWSRGATNALPPALAALQPWSVQYYSPEALRGAKDERPVAVVRIKLFGMHSTGGHSTPYFGLEVVSGAGAETYRPKPSVGGASGNSHRSCSPVTDRIYEIY